MKRILVTGATGNIGRQVIRCLFKERTNQQIIAGVYDLEEAQHVFADYPELELLKFDFQDQATYASVLQGIDTVFLLRPPNLADVDAIFKPLINAMKRSGVQEIVFLSVQGAEKSKFIPHHGIENAITESGLDYIFLRPSYFMQNLTTTLAKDIREKRKIILPAGAARFTWIDVYNIGEVAAKMLVNVEHYRNQAIVLTGTEYRNFYEVEALINATLDTDIDYVDVNPLKFFLIKRKEGMKPGMIMVVILLHYIQRFMKKDPQFTQNYQKLTGKQPTTLREFVLREATFFETPNQQLVERHV